MKTTIISTLLAVFLSSGLFASNGHEFRLVSKDTVEIVFGKNSKILILVKSKEDLERLQQYDINAMLRDLNLELSNDEGGKDVLVIEDETGKKYLKDTTIVYNEEDPEFKELEEEFDEEEQEVEADKDHNDNWWKDKDNGDHNFTDDKFIGKRTHHRTMMDFGMNNYLRGDGGFPDSGNEPYTVKPWGSWYVSLGPSFQTNIAGPLAVEWGSNVSWYNFKYQDPSWAIMKGDEMVEWTQRPEPSPQKSKLTVAYLNASIVPMLDFGYHSRIKTKEDGSTTKHLHHNSKKFRIGLGGYAGYRIDSYSKFVYEEDGDKNKDHSKNNYYLNNFRYGLRFVMGYDEFDLFFNYDLNPLFAENNGPDLNAFSFGISF